MSYPLIILGAGASYDCVQETRSETGNHFRPPLTKDIFHKNFEDIINKHSEVKNLASSILSRLKEGENFESILTSIKNKAEKNQDRLKQLIDFEFYLQELFKTISKEYGNQTGSNYRALIQDIYDNFKKACIVNFNYDLLLDEALEIKTTDNLDSYIKGYIKIIKVHGSCDWVFSLQDHWEIEDSREFLLQNPLYLDGCRARKEPIFRFTSYSKYSKSGMKSCYGPAIAIPLYGKDGFVCPKTHIDVLERSLADVDKILIIGWAANDQHLIDMIKEKTKRPIEITVVAGNKKEIDDIFSKFPEEDKFLRAAECYGFSKFMGSKACKTFFGTA